MKRLALFAALALLCMTSQAWAIPTLTAASDRTKWTINDTGTMTVTLAVPATDTATIAAPSIALPLPAGFSVVSATGQGIREISNQATATWTGGSAVSNIVTFRVTGASLTPTISATAVTLAVAAGLQPGESAVLTVNLKRVS